MRRFDCPQCHSFCFFGNDRCGVCGADLAYEPFADAFELVGPTVVRCHNHGGPGVCNWVAADGWACLSCWLDLVDDLSPLVAPFQAAKRRTLRQLIGFGIDPRGIVPALRFELLESTPGESVTTGHADGVITLDVAEGDPVRLAEIRDRLGERYRTPVGHVRHELGHWYWAAFVDRSVVIEDFRQRFGDERADYAEALERHYAQPSAGFDGEGAWRAGYVSNYASAHPWEDFAESFAHYLHMTDTIETAWWFPLIDVPVSAPRVAPSDFDAMQRVWVDLTPTLNELNRSIGVPDAYPFAPSDIAIDKIRWIHRHLNPGSHAG